MHSRILLPLMTVVALGTVLLPATYGTSAEPGFVAIPESQKPLYRFDLGKWFYQDDEARKQDRAEADRLLESLKALEPKVAGDPRALLDAIVLSEKLWTVADRLWAYASLRYATSTADAQLEAEDRQANELQGRVRSATGFIVSAIGALPQEDYDALVRKEPGLAKYEHFLRRSRREAAHRAPGKGEELLSELASHLDPFQVQFRTLMIKRSPAAGLTVGMRKLNVTDANGYSELLRDQDRKIRQQAFESRMATYKAQGDLFAFALFEKTLAANKVAGLRRFDDSFDEALEGLQLTPELADRVLKAFRDHASLALRFQKAEQKYQQSLLKLPAVEPWDMDASPGSLTLPRHTVDDASKAVLSATSIFGDEYRKEAEHLLDPKNGRLDIVPGPNRMDGDFTIGSFGPGWVFFMHGYDGQTSQVVTLAHEAAHAIHFRLLFNSGVPYSYSDGARYYSEGCAKVNELLVLDTLAKQAKGDLERVYYKRQLASKLASVRFTSMYWAALATSFEREVVKRIKSGQITSADQIHDVWKECGELWSTDFAKYPDLKYTWPDTHHFFTSSRQYSQYLFAWVVALAFYERAQNDPQAGQQFITLMKRGFSDEAAVLLKKEMNIVLDDPALIDRMFKMVESRVAEFENAVSRGGK